MEEISVRYAERCAQKTARPSRDHEDVWKVFKAPLERRQVTKCLRPKESKLQTAYIQARNILNKMPCKHEFVQEDEAEDFAEALKNEIKERGE